MLNFGRILVVAAFSAGALFSGCEKKATAEIQPTSAAAAVPISGDCSPFGEPISNNPYTGNNSFALCKADKAGDRIELRIACGENTLRKGWRWHIWCNADGSNCNCDQKGKLDWSAGDHCTKDGQAQPGVGSCANWN